MYYNVVDELNVVAVDAVLMFCSCFSHVVMLMMLRILKLLIVLM